MDIVVVGSCNTDLISYVKRFPNPGETIQGSKFSMGFGGKGANQCVMAAKLGAKTAMVSKVGKDTFGDGHIKNFMDQGINIDYVFSTNESSTGAAPICVDETGQNSIVIVPGANLLLNSDDLGKAEEMISKAKVVICQLEIDPDITLAALKMARKHKVKTVFNPAPAVPLGKEFYQFSDIICPNETETEILTGCRVIDRDTAGVAAETLQKSGCHDVIITMGEMGAVVKEEGVDGITHICPPIMEAYDTTGAGDAFIGSLAYFLATRPDLDLQECARRAVMIASESVKHPGTQTSFPKQSDLPKNLFL